MGLVLSNFKAMSKKEKMLSLAFFAMTTLLALGVIFSFSFAVDGATEVKTVLENMLDIVVLIFQAVGIVLSIYSVGQLIMAFKNEDADSKSRASTMLVVGVCLVAIPSIVKQLGLFSKFGTSKGGWS